jgi:hypothetical protein
MTFAFCKYKKVAYYCGMEMSNTQQIEIYKVSVLDLNKGDLCFMESGDKRATALIEVEKTKVSKSGKFITVYFYKITESDFYSVGNKVGKNYNHSQKGSLFYISKSINYNVELA